MAIPSATSTHPAVQELERRILRADRDIAYWQKNPDGDPAWFKWAPAIPTTLIGGFAGGLAGSSMGGARGAAIGAIAIGAVGLGIGRLLGGWTAQGADDAAAAVQRLTKKRDDLLRLREQVPAEVAAPQDIPSTWTSGITGTAGGSVGQMIPVGESSSSSTTQSETSGGSHTSSRRRFTVLDWHLDSPFSRETTTTGGSKTTSTTNSKSVDFVSSSQPFVIGERIGDVGAHRTLQSAVLDPRAENAVVVEEAGGSGFSLYGIDVQPGAALRFQQQEQILIGNAGIKALVANGSVFQPAIEARDELSGDVARVFQFAGTRDLHRRGAMQETEARASVTWQQFDGYEGPRKAEATTAADPDHSVLRLTRDEAMRLAVIESGAQAIIETPEGAYMVDIPRAVTASAMDLRATVPGDGTVSMVEAARKPDDYGRSGPPLFLSTTEREPVGPA